MFNINCVNICVNSLPYIVYVNIIYFPVQFIVISIYVNFIKFHHHDVIDTNLDDRRKSSRKYE